MASKIFENLITLILVGLTIALVAFSLSTLLSYPTGTNYYQDDANFEMPHSMTFCGWFNYRNNQMNFDDWTFDDMLEFQESNRIVEFAGLVEEKYYRNMIKLDDSATMLRKFNMTQEQIWQNEIKLFVLEPFLPVLCNTVNFPQNLRDFTYWVMVNTSLNDKLFLEMDERPKFYWYASSTFDYHYIMDAPLDRKGVMFYLEMETRKAVKNCDPGNTLDDIDCLKDFVTDKMGCSIPWGNHPTSAATTCKTSEELKKYRDLRLEMLQAKHQEELEQRGCISTTLANCNKKHWPYQDGGETGDVEVLKAMFQLDLNVSSNDIHVYLFAPKMIASVVEEYYIYGFSNLIADTGGYLGLFMGASVLTIIEMVQNLVKMLTKSRA